MNEFYYLEIFITIIVIFIQFRFFLQTKKKLVQLQNLFPDSSLDENFIIKTEVNGIVTETIKIDNDLFTDSFSELLNTINKYLSKNKGAVDFTIIRSIVERSIQSKENDVASTVSLPLYIGLMGTFVGIILGLLKIAFFGGVTDENINAFIGGILIAMVASLWGLVLTVISNSQNFKIAKRDCDARKNEFYNFLQVELLPHLGNSLFDALGRLKDNLNQFNDKFGNNVKMFDDNFSSNVMHLKTSVESIAENISPIIENTKAQKEFLEAIRKIGYDRMAQANLKVFNVMKDAGPLFIEFIDKQKQLNKSIERTATFVNTIEGIMNRVSTFENSINNLGERIDNADYMQSDLLNKVKSKLSLLDEQFELLKQHSQKSSNDINDFFEREYNKISGLTSNIRREVERALDFNIDHNPLQKLMLLDKLNELDNLKERLIQIEKQSKETSSNVSKITSDLWELKEHQLAKNNKNTDQTDLSSINGHDLEKKEVEPNKRTIKAKSTPWYKKVIKRLKGNG